MAWHVWRRFVRARSVVPDCARATAQVTVQVGGASYLGIGVADITAERAKALNLKEERGAEVTNVAEDSPAAKAGIKEGDVVLEYDGAAVQGIEQLTRLVRETPVGRQVKIVGVAKRRGANPDCHHRGEKGHGDPV